MIIAIYDRGGGGSSISTGHIFNLFVGKMSGFYSVAINYKIPSDMVSGSLGSTPVGNAFAIYNNGISFRATTAVSSSSDRSIVEIDITGNFNYDDLRIENDSSFSRRVEVRNEYGALLCDNGLPWGDGSYPPDAKNRAGLAGLHASPAVINPELEAALMGDATNKERVQE